MQASTGLRQPETVGRIVRVADELQSQNTIVVGVVVAVHSELLWAHTAPTVGR
jgi:hypothetical protein